MVAKVAAKWKKRAKKLNSFWQMTKLCVMSKRLGYHLHYICWISANVCHHWSFHHLMFSRISKFFNFYEAKPFSKWNVGHQMYLIIIRRETKSQNTHRNRMFFGFTRPKAFSCHFIRLSNDNCFSIVFFHSEFLGEVFMFLH